MKTIGLEPADQSLYVRVFRQQAFILLQNNIFVKNTNIFQRKFVT